MGKQKITEKKKKKAKPWILYRLPKISYINISQTKEYMSFSIE